MHKEANPAPLGLLGFGMTTILLNLHNSGIISLSVVIIAMGFALGGLAQIIAGIMEFKNNNTFGATAFTAYGCFWWSLIIIWCNPWSQYPSDSKSMGCYLDCVDTTTANDLEEYLDEKNDDTSYEVDRSGKIVWVGTETAIKDAK